jgi:hypothetical protein
MVDSHVHEGQKYELRGKENITTWRKDYYLNITKSLIRINLNIFQ